MYHLIIVLTVEICYFKSRKRNNMETIPGLKKESDREYKV